VRLRRLVRRLLGRDAAPLAPPVYVGDNTLLAMTAYGSHLYLDSRDTSLTPSIVRGGMWEADVTRLFSRTIRPGDHVVDIGANCGYFTVLAAQLVGSGGRVVAIDANPRMVELTRRSIAANGYIYVASAIHGAVVESARDVEIGIPDELMGSGSMLVRDGEHPMAVRTVTAPGKPLADFLGGSRRIDVLKIDAEGAEPLIMKGAADLLMENRDIKIFMELAPAMQAHFEPPLDFLARLRGFGFRIQRICDKGELETVDDAILLQRPLSELFLSR
jgi:FkbM family methyltransferase